MHTNNQKMCGNICSNELPVSKGNQEPAEPQAEQPSEALTPEQKLDEILALVKAQQAILSKLNETTASGGGNKIQQYENQIKEELIDFMMNHLNIQWLDDTIERDAYEGILSIIFEIINKFI